MVASRLVVFALLALCPSPRGGGSSSSGGSVAAAAPPAAAVSATDDTAPAAPPPALPPFSVSTPSTWPAWVISLARSPARLARFRAHSAAPSEFPRLLEFAATDGAALELAHDARFSPRARVRVLEHAARRSDGDLATRGMMGLYVSHADAWRAFLASGDAVGIVFEDDALVPRGLAAAMAAAAAGMPPPGEWDVWLLGTVRIHARAPAPPGWPPGWTRVTRFWGTQAYALTRRGAAALLARAFPADVQIDTFMAVAAELGGVLTLARAEGDALRAVEQFPFWQQFTTVQDIEVECNLRCMPDDYDAARDNATLRAAGFAAGALLALVGPRLLAAASAALLRCTGDRGAARTPRCCASGRVDKAPPHNHAV